MWSYDSAKNRELRVRSVVERSIREGLGAEEVVFWPDLLDYAVVVAPRDDFASILTSESDLEVSPEDGALTMAEAMSSIGSDGRGREEALDRSVDYGVLSDGGGSKVMVADLPANSSDGSALIGAPVKMVADGVELQMSAECSGMVQSDQCLSVSSSPSSTVAGLQGDDSEVRGRGAVVGQPTVVSAMSDSDGGQAKGRLGDALTDASCAKDLPPAALPCPFAVTSVDSASTVDDFVCGPVPLLDVHDRCDGVGGLVREEGRAPPKAQEALRPQSADGLRQLPRPSEEPMPVSVVEAVTEVVTSMVEIPNLELGEGSLRMIDDVEGLVGQIVLHGDEACVVQRGGGHVVVGDELPPSGLQVCPPSPLSPSPLVAGGVHGCGGDLISTMDSGEIRGTGLDRVSIYPTPETSCEEAFTDGRAVKWDLQNSTHSLLRSDMVVAECTLQRDAPLSRPQIRDCADEQRYGIVGVAVDQPFSVGIGVGEADSLQEVDGGAGSAAMMMPTETFCSTLPYVPSMCSVVDTFIDGGCVREEVQALRPQPTDGLWQPLSSSTEPVSERVKKEKGIHGGDSGRTSDSGDGD
ncbi:hypothetical protein Dimus_030472 [Dionaea muscipula]